jgi:hypothetical protein
VMKLAQCASFSPEVWNLLDTKQWRMVVGSDNQLTTCSCSQHLSTRLFLVLGKLDDYPKFEMKYCTKRSCTEGRHPSKQLNLMRLIATSEPLHFPWKTVP